ncbi:glycoside hydrolase/phage tail family protein [Methylosinus sp. Sm6]|uniref:baseplate multidomain protein megatron n=1 Tax=Methylosinus sp. Sm6 TaxID=2866948 RepID=UPI001C99F573|nr:glycoside hydrolase/phage tail family protein [Methylosinus sp. Sm6]MBY6242847.1 glycoside hydrolase/phage tail family protein [Methylosinus sp. Sm6]
MATMLIGTVVSTVVGAGLGVVGRLIGGGGAKSNTSSVTFGQRVDDVYLSGSSEDAAIRKLWGRMRLGGNVIWCSNFTEYETWDASYSPNASSGKGGGGGGGGGTTVNWTVNYHYIISCAVAFCEGGATTTLGRVWADGKELDLSEFTWRFYNGSDQQVADTHIESIEGVGNVPAYRGIAYLVFENMDVSKFGNRIPQITAEIIRRPAIADANDLNNSLRSVCLIPGSGEFVYGTQIYRAAAAAGSWRPQNGNAEATRPDLMISLDQLAGAGADAGWFPPTAPLEIPWSGIPDKPTGGNWRAAAGALSAPAAVSLVVSWFGTDLRAGVCQIVPKVETTAKDTAPADWSVAGYTRRGTAWFILLPYPPWFTGPVPYGTPDAVELLWGSPAQVVSYVDPSLIDPTASGTPVPAFGGTPSDNTVIEAIQEIKRRGLRCVFYPFVMMDIPAGNTLPNPYSDYSAAVGQAPFPWRGRITCSPAPGYAGTVDKTPAAATQIDAFFAQYSNMILHYANLCVQAGGVHAFIIGSELIGLTSVRSSAGDGNYPAVNALKNLAASVRAIVGSGCKIGYAADWSEYHAHRPNDVYGEVIFNLDPLWGDPNIDFVGIDNYLPLSDWRDDEPNADAATWSSIYDRDYLRSNIEGGEYFDWYYASDAARVAQTRTSIVDYYGQHWVWRQKDIRGWWSNWHQSRPGGVPNAWSTAWVPGSKPIWFAEFGSPAIDKGPNQPNVFVDPKSSESFTPYFSSGARDDAVQRAYLEAMLSYWRDHAPTIGSIKMVEPKNMFAWCWDARPFPDFPAQGSTWRDGYNYELGHWLTGRLTEVPLQWIIAELCALVGVSDLDTTKLLGPDSLVLGAAADGVVSPRDIIEGLDDAFQFGAHESGGKLVFASRITAESVAISADDLVMESESDVGYSLTRAQETDLPGALSLSFLDAYADYATGKVTERKDVGSSNNVASVSTPAVLEPPRAASVARSLLQQRWAAREKGQIKLPPSKAAALDPSDCIALAVDGVALTMRVDSIDIAEFRTLALTGFDPSLARVFPEVGGAGRNRLPATTIGAPVVEILDIPIATGDERSPYALRAAAYSSPWGAVAIYRSTGDSHTLVGAVNVSTPMGELTEDLYSGPRSVWDHGNAVYVSFYGATTLLSATESQVFAGANAIAVKNGASGQWEVIQFATAELVGVNAYKLTKLLRGQLGTEAGMANPVAAGARVIVLNASTLATIDMTVDQLGQAMTLRAGPAIYDRGDATYHDYTVTPQGVGLRPWSPSQLAGARDLGSGDVTFTWARRTRYGGDAWEAADAPLNEQSESYDLEIMNGSSVARTVSALSSPSFLYTAAAQSADFGALQSSYSICVYQRSAQIGRGQAASKTVVL